MDRRRARSHSCCKRLCRLHFIRTQRTADREPQIAHRSRDERGFTRKFSAVAQRAQELPTGALLIAIGIEQRAQICDRVCVPGAQDNYALLMQQRISKVLALNR